MVLGFRLLPGVFDTLVGPLMRLLGRGRTEVDANAGNVLEPPWARGRARTVAAHWG